jgi:nitrous-oxide reductase
MKSISIALGFLMALSSCSRDGEDKKPQVSESFVSGELAKVAQARGLSPKDLLSAAKTYNPSGHRNEYLALFGTGVSGRLAVVGMPSMKILKYVSVFSAEPWQGYAFDDESKAITKASAREEIEYAYGDSGTPALSLTNGKHDAKVVFMADAANGRIGLVDLAEYEAKQIVSHPLFKNSTPDLTVTQNTRYVIQSTAAAETKNILGTTFWHFIEKENDGHKIFLIDPATSFSVLVTGTTQNSPAAGKGATDGFAFTISKSGKKYLNVIDWKNAESQLAVNAVNKNGHLVIEEKTALEKGILKTLELPDGSDRIIISGNGEVGLITNRTASTIQLIDLRAAATGKLSLSSIEVGGPSVDGAFAGNNLYVSVHEPSKLVRIDLASKTIKNTYKLDFPVGKIMIPEADTSSAQEKYAVIANLSPIGRFTPVGPQTGLSAHLVDISGEEMKGIYDASIPQTTRLDAVALSTEVNKPVYKYKIGTDPRSGHTSPYKTGSGKERIVRDGKRVHIYGSLIRSHITPDFIEVEQGDIVSIHLTSNEQSKDNAHGFTIDTYNVHGSFEPGKTASFTFVADRPGVFPFYCTEFCSALHLEMQGYLLVKPMNNKQVAQTDKLLKLHSNKKMNDFFKYIKGE